MNDPGGRVRLIESVHIELALRLRQGVLDEIGDDG